MESIHTIQVRDLRSQHTCEAFVRSCIDFRVCGPLAEYVQREFDVTYDLSAEPGGVKDMLEEAEQEFGVKGLLISCRLHHMHTVILSAHEDCGAYGGSQAFSGYEAERAFHIEELKRARRVIHGKFKECGIPCDEDDPKCLQPMQYILLWVHFSEDGTAVEIERIEES